ncbi:MAG: hypothetical protein JXR03_14685 [Cyclobacteriaceae bacterium]
MEETLSPQEEVEELGIEHYSFFKEMPQPIATDIDEVFGYFKCCQAKVSLQNGVFYI